MRARSLLIGLGGAGLLLVLFIASISFRAIPQPLIEIKAEPLWQVRPLPIKNTLLTSWCVAAVIIVLAYFSGRNLKWQPSGWQNFVESIIEGAHSLVVNTAGEKNGRRFFWVIATFFIYIALSNWFALLPVFNAIGKVEPIGAEAGEFHEEAVVVQKAGVSFINFQAKFIELEVDEAPCAGLAGEEHDTCLEEQRAAAIAAAKDEHGLGENEELAIMAP